MDTVGTQAQASLISPGSNKDILIQAKGHGTAYNGYSIQLIDDHTVAVGSEKVAVDSVAISSAVFANGSERESTSSAMTTRTCVAVARSAAASEMSRRAIALVIVVSPSALDSNPAKVAAGRAQRDFIWFRMSVWIFV